MEWVLGGIVMVLAVWLFVVAVMQQQRRKGTAKFSIDEHRDSTQEKPNLDGPASAGSRVGPRSLVRV